ncbi:MAG: HAMP domain-containing protein [Nitrospirae bacterium]|nr:HAMP domain-containing protein [Nitrospirota bacterium]
MKPLNTYRNSFSTRVFITAAVFIIFFSSICSAWFISIQKKSLVDKLILEGELISELLAANARIGIFAENDSVIIPYVDSVLTHEEAVSVSVFNAEGKLLLNKTREDIIHNSGKDSVTAHYSKKIEQIITKIKTAPKPLHLDNANTVEFWQPVTAYTGYIPDTSVAATKGRLIGFAAVTLSKGHLNHSMETIVFKSILTTLLFLAVGLLITYSFIRHISLPVRKLMYGIKNFSDTGFPGKISVLSRDEFGQLAEAFNSMIDELQRRQDEKERLESQILHNHKMDVIGCLAADISKEFGSLVNVFTSKIFRARNYLSPGHMAYEELDNLKDSIEQARNITRKLSEISKNTPNFMEVQSPGTFLKQAAPLLMMQSSLKLDLIIDDNLRNCNFDKWQINRVMGIILDNAKDASLIDSTITIEVRNIDISDKIDMIDGQYAMVSIRDNGIGISRENMGKIFTPFFTTKDNRYGLGLAMAFSIIKNHGGHIEAVSEENKGTVINIFLPSAG